MADRVPWPRKTGGTWGLATHSTCSPPFLVHSRVFRSDMFGAKLTRESCHHVTLWKQCDHSRHPHVARPGRFDRIALAAEYTLPFLNCTFDIGSDTVRLPLRCAPTPCAPCRMLCATCVGMRFNDAAAFWQLMGCVTGPSDRLRGAASSPRAGFADGGPTRRQVIGSPRVPAFPASPLP